MTKDSYCEISEYFGIPTEEQLITNSHDMGILQQISVSRKLYMPSTDYVVKVC